MGWVIFGTKNAKARLKMSNKFGARFCGFVRDAHSEPISAMYNDDEVTGGSFCVPVIHDDLDVAKALDELRARFAAVK